MSTWLQSETGEANDSGPICLWRLPQGLSQSRIGGRKRRSYACTIIALKMATNLALMSPSLQGPLLPPIGGTGRERHKGRNKRKSSQPLCPGLQEALLKRPKLTHHSSHSQRPLDGGLDSEELLSASSSGGHSFIM